MKNKEINELLREAYLRGFQASGEGWNGEYPGDAENSPEWNADRAASLKDILRKERKQ